MINSTLHKKIKPPSPQAFYGTRQRIFLKSWKVDRRLSVFSVEVKHV
jgi:hypothetical protein